MEHSFFDPRFDINSAYQNSGCKLKSTLHMVQDYCLSFGRKMQFSKRNAASCQGFLHDLQGFSLLKKLYTIFSKEHCKRMTHASLQPGEASLLYLILHLEQECNMLDSCYILLQKHISPSKEGCTSFEGSPAFLKKTCDILQGIVERFMQLYQWY